MNDRFSRWAAAPALALGLTALALVTSPAAARPTVADPAVEARLETLQKQVAELSAEVARLRQAPGARTDTAELERRIDLLAREIEKLRAGEEPEAPPASAHGMGPAASKIYGKRHGVSIGGYGEMLVQAPADQREDGSPSGARTRADILRAVLYTGYKWDDRLLLNSEVEIEHATTGEGAEEKGEVSVEFAYLEYQWSEKLGLRGGLMLIPVGLVNELHEPTTFLAARRPLSETRILPSTWREAGVGLFGESGRLSYRAYLVNGLDAAGFGAAGIRDGRQGGSNALAESLAFTGRVDFKPTLATRLGASLFAGHSGQGSGLDVPTTTFDLHGEYHARGFEARALFTRATIGDAASLNRANGLEGSESVGEVLAGGYVEGGFDLMSLASRESMSLIPFVRWERLDTQVEVPEGYAGDPANDQTAWTIGVAFRPHPQVVIKADWQDLSNQARSGVNQWNLALGYIF